MTNTAICYAATDGYLFQTMVSAGQARRHASREYPVIVFHVGQEPSVESQVFACVARALDVEFRRLPSAILCGYDPRFAKVFIESALPEGIDEFLYLDGDTQIVSNIDALVGGDLANGRIHAARDPMVLLMMLDGRLGRRVETWWDESAIPLNQRKSYVNSGVFKIGRNEARDLRVALMNRTYSQTRFLDQDLLNLALSRKIEIISQSWNFPAFLLSTRLEELVQPKVIHFMSTPGPWNAPSSHWPAKYLKPYSQFRERFPESAPFVDQFSMKTRVRYVLQQKYKRLVERPAFQSLKAVEATIELERNTISI